MRILSQILFCFDEKLFSVVPGNIGHFRQQFAQQFIKPENGTTVMLVVWDDPIDHLHIFCRCRDFLQGIYPFFDIGKIMEAIGRELDCWITIPVGLNPNVSPTKVECKAVFPRRSGYSTSGTVLSVGEGVTAVVPGDRVAMLHTTHSEFLEVEEKNLCKLIDNIAFKEAAIWHIATFPLAAIRKCRLEIGESAIVMGMGILGMMAVKLLRAAGATPIIAADPVAEKREEALLLGADYALDPFALDFAQKVKTLTAGGCNIAIEVTGHGKALDTVLDCMALFGRVALLGCTRNSDFTIDYYRKVHAPGITMVAEVHSPYDAFEIYRRLAAEKTFPLVQFDWSMMK